MSVPTPEPSPGPRRENEEHVEEQREERHEEAVEEREAFESWGYLFKPDKTGTEKLRSLLRGLKDVINQHYSPTDGTADLTPTQLAAFYRDLGGNYDTLFLGTPSASLAFIYKSLGCLHSLQPQPYSTAFTDPTVPALKTEGWIMWQTIQILLGPEEHSSFLRAAVAKWEVRADGEVLPRVLPRGCFPEVPDRHMVAWYEGVSERLKREAEMEAEGREVVERVETESEAEDAGSERGPALAYFRNPMFRHVDPRGGAGGGRPAMERRDSSGRKGPGLSPKPTFVERVKSVVSPGGREVRRASRGPASRSRDRDRRRRSVPDHRQRYSGEFDHVDRDGYNDRLEPDLPPPRHHPHDPRYRRRSSRSEHPVSAGAPLDTSEEEELAAEERAGSKPPTPLSPPGNPYPHHHPHHHHHGHLSPELRHTKSHDPTPTREPSEYFPPPSSAEYRPRRSSAYESEYPASPPSIQTGGIPSVGPSFGPSASPLFASHIARQPQPPPPPTSASPPVGAGHIPYPPRGMPGRRPPREGYDSPAPSMGSRGRHPHPHHRRRSRPPYDERSFYDDESPPPRRRSMSRRRSRSEIERKEPFGKRSGSEIEGEREWDRDRRRGSMGAGSAGAPPPGRLRQTRFADVGGVGGRRYPDGSPWQGRG